MKKIVLLLALVPALTWGAAPFDGTWVTKADTIRVTGKPDGYLLANGSFTCSACYPELKIKADGSDQKVSGHAYYDTASAKAIDAQRVQVSMRSNGKPWAERMLTVAADGKTMVEEFVSYEGPKHNKGKIWYDRVDPAPAGAHAISGSWQTRPGSATLSPDLLTVTLLESKDGLKMSTPTGQSYDAKFDGKQYPIVGDTGKTMVALKRINAKTIQETDTRDGKVTDIQVFKVSADGKTLTAVDDDKLHDTKTTYTAEKK